MIQFFQTIMGKKFFETDVPRVLTVLGRIADSLEMLAVETKIANDIAEKGRGPLSAHDEQMAAQDVAHYEAVRKMGRESGAYHMRQAAVALLHDNGYAGAARMVQALETGEVLEP